MSALRLVFVLAALLLGTTGDAAHADELTFALRIEDGRLPPNMRLIRVKQGDVVRLRWSTDKRVVLHLHGYDIEKAVEPGAVAVMSFTARATGRFPIHVHGAKEEAHEEALANVEVYPR